MHALRVPSGSVRGLRVQPSFEPEVVCTASRVHASVPRLVAPYSAQPGAFEMDFETVCLLLDQHALDVASALDTTHLTSAYVLLERLCEGYVRAATAGLEEARVSLWHHKLLSAWCSKRLSPTLEGGRKRLGGTCAAERSLERS